MLQDASGIFEYYFGDHILLGFLRCVSMSECVRCVCFDVDCG